MSTSTPEVEAPRRTTLFEKFSYGMGDVACNVVFALTAGLVVYFYTNVIGISAALVGTILLVSRIFDGVSDLVIAQLVDKTKSRFGKARPWILWMAFPYAISAVALFAIPPDATEWVQAVYIFVTYNLCTTIVYTALNLPYAALAPLMTRDEEDSAKINLFRMSMSPIGNMIVTALTLPFIRLLGGDQRAWIIVTSIYGVIAVGMLLWTFVVCKERVRLEASVKAEALPFLQRLGAAMRNKFFLILIASMIGVSLYQGVNGVMTTYYSQYLLGNEELMGPIQVAEKVPWILGIIFLAPFIRRFGKRNLVLIGALICVLGQLVLMIAPENFTVVMIAAVLRGVGEAPFYGCIFTMIADTVDYGHWRTGIRVHALLFSAFTVGQKIGAGITGWAIGQLMEGSGFTGQRVEVPSAVAMVKGLYIWGGLIPWVLLAVLMLLYRLDKHYASIRSDLVARGEEASAS